MFKVKCRNDTWSVNPGQLQNKDRPLEFKAFLVFVILGADANTISLVFLWTFFSTQTFIQLTDLAKKKIRKVCSVQFISVQLLSRVRLFATQWITARQDSLSITNSRSLLRLTSIESVMPSSHLILCRPLLLLPSIPPSIRVFSNESTLHEVAKVLEFQL